MNTFIKFKRNTIEHNTKIIENSLFIPYIPCPLPLLFFILVDSKTCWIVIVQLKDSISRTIRSRKKEYFSNPDILPEPVASLTWLLCRDSRI